MSVDLVNREIPEDDRAAALERAGRLRSLTLDSRTVADLELIATGGYSPLTGFMGQADGRSPSIPAPWPISS